MADNLYLKTKYPTIQSLKDQGLPADIIAIAEETQQRLIATRKISELEAGSYNRIKALFTDGRVTEALTEIGKSGINLPQTLIKEMQEGLAKPVKSNEKYIEKFAKDQIPFYTLFSGAGEVSDGITGGLTGLWNRMFPAQGSSNVYFSPTQAQGIAAAYAGAIYERSKDVAVESFWNGLFSKNFFTYLGAGGNTVINFLGGSEFGIAIQAAITWLLENVNALFSDKVARSFEEISNEVRASYEKDSGKGYGDYVRSKQLAKAQKEALEDLKEAKIITPEQSRAVSPDENTRLENAKGEEIPNQGPVNPPPRSSQTPSEEPQVWEYSDQTTGWSPNGLFALSSQQSGPSNQGKPSKGAPSPTTEESNLAKIFNGSGKVAGSIAGGVVTLPLITWNKANDTVKSSLDGEFINAGSNGLQTLLAAKGTQVMATGMPGRHFWSWLPVVGGKEMGGVVQGLGWAGKKIGEKVEKLGGIPDSRANAKDVLGAKTWVAQQAEEAKAALKASNPAATEKQLERAALKAEAKAEKIAGKDLEILKSARAAETNIVENIGKGVQHFADKLTQKADEFKTLPILKSPWLALKAMGRFGAETIETIVYPFKAAAAEQAMENFKNAAAAAATARPTPPTPAPKGFRMSGGAASTVGLGALIAGGATYAMTGDAKAAAHNAGEALPVAGTIMAANQGRTAEAWMRGITDAGIAGSLLTAPLAATGVGAVVPGLIAGAAFVGNEVARPIARLAGLDMDPSLGEMAARSAATQIDEAGKRVAARKTEEYTGAELRDGLLDKKSVIYAHFAGEALKQYDKTLAQLKADNDGELPSMLPASLRNRDAYIAARIDETLRLKTGPAAMDAPTGVKRLSPPTTEEGIAAAAAAAEMARESAKASGLGKTGIQAAPQKPHDLVSFVPDTIAGNVADTSYALGS